MTSVTQEIANFCEKLSGFITRITGSSLGFGLALSSVIAWISIGERVSSNWQNLLSLSTSVAAFLLLFLLQRSHNKDTIALHLKLDELIASQDGASNRMLHIEEATESELDCMRELHKQLPKDSLESHSIEHVLDPETIKARD